MARSLAINSGLGDGASAAICRARARAASLSPIGQPASRSGAFGREVRTALAMVLSTAC
jgi:hypothetical protein